MTLYARVINNVAVELFTPPTGFTIQECFTADIAAQFQSVPSGTEAGATLANGTWTNPPPPSPGTAPYAALTPMQFYLAFTATERMKIKALASSAGVAANSPLFGGSNPAYPQDAMIAEFWSTYELAAQVNSSIDPNLVSIQEGLQYLSAPTTPTPAVITASRIPQILAGTPQ